eukprot:COSAG05_NODE_580_length_8553_cov_197.460934_10_plen_163_part_00
MIWRALHEYVNFVHDPEKQYRSLSEWSATGVVCACVYRLRIDGADVRGKINLTKFRNKQGGKFSGKQKLDVSRGGIAGGGLNRVGVGQLDEKGQFQRDVEALRVSHGEGLGQAVQARPSNKVVDQMERSHGMFSGPETGATRQFDRRGKVMGLNTELRHLGM